MSHIAPGTYQEDMAWATRMRAQFRCSMRGMAQRLFLATYTWEEYELGIRPVPDHVRRDAEHLWARGPLPGKAST